MRKPNATVTVEEISPERASEILAKPLPGQRNKRPVHINKLAADMIAKRFHLSPDAVLIIKGLLANGQHRLEAVVESGKAQWFIVMESNDEELYKLIDAGLKRTAADGLDLPHKTQLPAIARWVQTYNLKINMTSAEGGAHALRGGLCQTQYELISYCEDNSIALVDAASFVVPLYAETKVLVPSIGGAIYALAAANGKLEQAKPFLQQVYGQDNGHAASAATDLRNRLTANRGSKSKLRAGYIFGITLKAFKSYLNGTRPGVLKMTDGESLPAI